MAGENTMWDAAPGKISPMELQRKPFPELYLLKSLLKGPLNRTGKASSCLTQNNFMELWSLYFSHINAREGYDTPIAKIHYSIGLKSLQVSLGRID